MCPRPMGCEVPPHTALRIFWKAHAPGARTLSFVRGVEFQARKAHMNTCDFGLLRLGGLLCVSLSERPSIHVCVSYSPVTHERVSKDVGAYVAPV